MLESLWIIIFYFCIHQAKVINVTNTSNYSNITCPSSEPCEIICFEEQCNNMNIHCTDNDYKCSIHCTTNACQNTNIYFINGMRSEVICSSSESSISSQTCRDSQIYIEPRNNLSTVFVDIHSEIGYIERIQINYKGNESFPNDQISHYLNTTTSSIAIYPITILCRSSKSCRSSSIIISSVNYLKLYCLSTTSCYNMHMDFISHNENNRGVLDIVCNGALSCYNTEINAITADKFEMICDTSIDSCSATSIQCPIHSAVQLTDNSCVLHCNDPKSCSFSVIYAIYGMIQLNNLNKNPLHVANVVMHCGYDFNETCIVGHDCDNICIQMEQTDHIQMVLPFDDNNGIQTQLQCDTDTLCVIFMTTEWIQSAHCGHSSECMVICMDYAYCGNSHMKINATRAGIFRLQTLPHAYFQFADIYGPMDGEFISNAEINEATLYLSGTNEVEMICSSDQKCANLLVFANETNTIRITCSDPLSCQYISVFVNNMEYETSNISSPIPNCRLYWQCNDGCVNNTNEVVIHTQDAHNIQCDIYSRDTLSNEWYCNEYALSANCMITQNTTEYPWITSTESTYDNTLTDSILATSTVFLSSINDDKMDGNANKETFLSRSGGLLGIGILLLCCCGCVVGLLITKNLVQKKISNLKKQQKAPKKVGHAKKDTGTTVEDIIKESAALPFTNPLEVHVADNIAKTTSITSPSAPMKPAEEKEDHQVPLQFSANGWSASRSYYKQQQQRHSNRSIPSNYVYGRPPTMTVEGSTDVESRINRYSTDVDTITMSFERSRSPNLTPPTRNALLGISGHDGKQRTFSSPSLVVMSIYENGSNAHVAADGAEHQSSSEDSDGMYDSMHSEIAHSEGGKPTTGNTKGGDAHDGHQVTQSTS